MTMSGCIIGWSHMPFGKHEGRDLEDLIGAVVGDALADAGIEPEDVSEIVVGNYGDAFSAQGFPSSLVLQTSDALRFKPATRVENACATGSAAIHYGLNLLAAKKARFVLVVGVETMTGIPGPEIGDTLLKASYVKEEAEIEGGFAGVFGRIAQQYFQKHGDQSDALAMIAAKNHKNGCANPYAQLRKDLGYDFCRSVSDKNPIVAGPLKRTDCSLVSDGAAALVLTDLETALARDKAIVFRAAEQVNDFLPLSRRDITLFEGCEMAWKKAFASSGLSLEDLSLVETHDCFTIAELLEYEAMGLAERGKGAEVIAEGVSAKDGKLPINPSGGLKSKGHPIGATGVSMHALSAMQLMGEAGDMQIEGATLAGIFNMGGAAVANYTSILERLR
jgi:acetyl-CoA C-acetyltransferase